MASCCSACILTIAVPALTRLLPKPSLTAIMAEVYASTVLLGWEGNIMFKRCGYTL